MEWYLDAFRKKYADFSGRARRTEYWMFTLFHTLVILVFVILAAALAEIEWGMIAIIIILGLYVLFTIIPSLAITVRRLHDTGKSGWFYLLSFIPYIGGFLIFIFMVQDSEAITNKWGPNPKNPNADEINQIGEPTLD